MAAVTKTSTERSLAMISAYMERNPVKTVAGAIVVLALSILPPVIVLASQPPAALPPPAMPPPSPSAPPYLPPSMPPMSPGSVQWHRVSLRVIIAGSLDAFDGLAQTVYRNAIATFAGVVSSDVELTFAAASVAVTATVRTSAAEQVTSIVNVFTTLAPSPLSIAGNVTVISMDAPVVLDSVILAAPSPPPPLLPYPPQLPCVSAPASPARAMDDEFMDLYAYVPSIFFALLVCLFFAILRLYRRVRRCMRKKRTAIQGADNSATTAPAAKEESKEDSDDVDEDDIDKEISLKYQAGRVITVSFRACRELTSVALLWGGLLSVWHSTKPEIPDTVVSAIIIVFPVVYVSIYAYALKTHFDEVALHIKWVESEDVALCFHLYHFFGHQRIKFLRTALRIALVCVMVAFCLLSKPEHHPPDLNFFERVWRAFNTSLAAAVLSFTSAMQLMAGPGMDDTKMYRPSTWNYQRFQAALLRRVQQEKEVRNQQKELGDKKQERRMVVLYQSQQPFKADVKDFEEEAKKDVAKHDPNCTPVDLLSRVCAHISYLFTSSSLRDLSQTLVYKESTHMAWADHFNEGLLTKEELIRVTKLFKNEGGANTSGSIYVDRMKYDAQQSGGAEKRNTENIFEELVKDQKEKEKSSPASKKKRNFSCEGSSYKSWTTAGFKAGRTAGAWQATYLGAKKATKAAEGAWQATYLGAKELKAARTQADVARKQNVATSLHSAVRNKAQTAAVTAKFEAQTADVTAKFKEQHEALTIQYAASLGVKQQEIERKKGEIETQRLDMEKRISTLSDEVSSLRAEHLKANAEHEIKLQEANDKLVQELMKTASTKEASSSAVADLREQLGALKQENAGLRQEKVAHDEAQELLKEEKQTLEGKLEAVQKEKAELDQAARYADDEKVETEKLHAAQMAAERALRATAVAEALEAGRKRDLEKISSDVKIAALQARIGELEEEEEKLNGRLYQAELANSRGSDLDA